MKNTVLISVLLILAAAYGYFCTDWFSTPVIQIVAQIRRIPSGDRSSPCYPVSFTMNRDQHLDRIKVLVSGGATTNKNPIPVWHLVASSNAAPVRGFTYGGAVAGMKLADPKQPALPLLPNITYTLVIESGRARGSVDFQSQPIR